MARLFNRHVSNQIPSFYLFQPILITLQLALGTMMASDSLNTKIVPSVSVGVSAGTNFVFIMWDCN